MNKSRIPPPTSQNYATAQVETPTIPDNLSRANDEIKDLNFKVDPAFHRQFKLTASAWGMSMKELLEAAYNAWIDQHGERPESLNDLLRRK